MFRAAPDGCLVISADGRIREANPMVEKLFGWPAEELRGQPIETLVPNDRREIHASHRGRYAADPHNRPMGVGLELRGRRKDGSTFPVEVGLSPWNGADGQMSIICTVRDVSAQYRLRSFSDGALRASEEERKRIARELHDDTAQRLATLILRTRSIAEEEDPEARMALFESVREEIVDAADGVQRMSRGLRPPELEELGLALAVQAHVRSVQEVGHLEVEAAIGLVDPFLDIPSKLVVYRVLQEALVNVRKHAESPRAWLTLERRSDVIFGEVRDEGRGFDPAEVEERSDGLGLLGMHERAQTVGGQVDVQSSPGEGTRVRISVPVSVANPVSPHSYHG